MCVHSVKLLWVLPRSFTSNSHWRERARHLSEFFQEKWWRTGGKGRGGGWAEASLWVAPQLNHHLPLAPLSSLIPGRCQLGGAGRLKAHLGKGIVPRASSRGTPSAGSFRGGPPGHPSSPSTSLSQHLPLLYLCPQFHGFLETGLLWRVLLLEN